MSKYIYLLDAGHGGIDDNNVYTTSGKRSPIWKDTNEQYFEGEGNRIIRDELAVELSRKGIKYHYVSVGSKDVGLKERVAVINAYCDAYGKDNVILISIHSNGASNPLGQGWEVYTSRGQTKSDPIATVFYNEALQEFPRRKFRKDTKDGDVDKEANFYIIAKSKCRAILTENFFMTNKYECQNILLTKSGLSKIANLHLNGILQVEKKL